MVNPKYKALLRVAETGSFTQAANDLGYSQSGISGMISSLEKEMGVQLVRTRLRGSPPVSRRRGPAAVDFQRLQRRTAARKQDSRAEAPGARCGARSRAHQHLNPLVSRHGEGL